jgi:hypothetical protein
LLSIFKKLDTNGDNNISALEMLQAKEELVQKEITSGFKVNTDTTASGTTNIVGSYAAETQNALAAYARQVESLGLLRTDLSALLNVIGKVMTEVSANTAATLEALNKALAKNAVPAVAPKKESWTGKVAKFFGWSEGGYTGYGSKNETAGVVHKGEIVWSQEDIQRAGGISTVEALRLNGKHNFTMPESPMLRLQHFAFPANNPMNENGFEMKTLVGEIKDMKNLMVKLTADNNRMLTIERAMYADTVSA